MDAARSIKRHILVEMLAREKIIKDSHIDFDTADGIDDAWEQAEDYDGCFASIEIIDAIEEFRCGGQETDLPCKGFSRCYECEQVAAKLNDGSYTSWQYWSGGGKHGEPGGIDWMEDAFFVDCEEKQVMTTVYEFSVKDASISNTEQ